MKDIKKEKVSKPREIDNIDFTKLGIGDLIDLCLKCETKEDAQKVLEQYKKYTITPEIAYDNLGYMFGYANDKNKKKLYKLFPVRHPIFGRI